jgi:GTP-binding protein Era
VSEYRSGFVALAGRPNVGKSTLVNRLVGEHVVAVSDRPQTTRRRALGVVSRDGYQLVLADLPGFQKPFDRLTERMQRSVDETLGDVDAVVLMLNAREPIGRGDRHIAERVLREGSPPCVIVLNKVDGLRPDRIAPAMAAAATLGPFHSLHPVSALTGDGVSELLADLAGLLPTGPMLFPVEMTSDQSDSERAAEIIREAALAQMREEVPHAIAVEINEFDRLRSHTRIAARVICETESQKRILVGKGGTMVKRIGTDARGLLEEMTGRKVMLDLTVRVRPHWRRDSTELDRLGV